MAARQPQNVTASHFGDYVRIRWQDNTALTGDAPDGFKIYVDETTVVSPTWTVPPAVDNELNGGDGATPVQQYEVMYHYPSGVAAWWETCEEYPEGLALSASGGGLIWDGAWVFGGIVTGWFGQGDDCESYTNGQTSGFNGGTGWTSNWVTGL